MLLKEISQIHGSGIILLPKLEVGVLASVRYSVFPGISFFTFGLKPTVCLMTSQSLFKPEESGTSTWMCRIFLCGGGMYQSGVMYKSPDGFAAGAALAILTDISLRSILLRSISLVVTNAWPFMPASGQMSLHCDWTYTIKKPPPLNSQKRKPFCNILSTISSYHSTIVVSIIIYCGIYAHLFYEF